MACQKLCKQGRDVYESKGQHLGNAPSLHLFHTTVTQCMGKRITSSLAVGGCSSFSGHFLLQYGLGSNKAIV